MQQQKLKFWQVDAFTNQPFKGNPAAVFILNHEIDDTLMQQIAIEMNLSETAFVLLRGTQQNPLLRWFTPTFEIDLCGHATLASAHIILTEINPNLQAVTFDTKFVGQLKVTKPQQNKYTMDFPARPGSPIKLSSLPAKMLQALSPVMPNAAFKSRDLMLIYDDPQVVIEMKPDFTELKKSNEFFIVTAPSQSPEFDFISRFFCPNDVVIEDPVTGSAHCTSAPYWASRLNKTQMNAYQASERGGYLEIQLQGERVFISGEAITVMNGELYQF